MDKGRWTEYILTELGQIVGKSAKTTTTEMFSADKNVCGPDSHSANTDHVE